MREGQGEGQESDTPPLGWSIKKKLINEISRKSELEAILEVETLKNMRKLIQKRLASF